MTRKHEKHTDSTTRVCRACLASEMTSEGGRALMMASATAAGLAGAWPLFLSRPKRLMALLH